MIKNIYLHIGLHKTASSSIQKSLGISTNHLKENGYLYPVFNIFGIRYFNHSIFFRNLFTNNPLTSDVNVRNRITTKEKQNEFIEEFKKQLHNQVEHFEGENLIFSGEFISILDSVGIKKMKEFFTICFNDQCVINILLIIRNPITRAPSIIQQNVKGSGHLSLNINNKKNRLFTKTATTFIEHFKKEKIEVIRFEDAIAYPGGPAAKILSVIGAPQKIINKVPNLHVNEKLSYEAVLILSTINERIPFKVNGVLNPLRANVKLKYFHEIPGTKFQITKDQQIAIWKNSIDDIKWISENFNCPAYQFDPDSLEDNEIIVKWETPTLNAISTLLEKQDKKVKNIIIKCIFHYIRKHKNQYPFHKRKKMYYYLASEWKKSLFNK